MFCRSQLTWHGPSPPQKKKKTPCPAQNFLGCWMKKVRVKWGFSTAGRTLLCLTLTGVSGKSWLSCKNTGVCYPHGPRGTVTNPLCSGGVNLTKARMLFFVCLFCFYFKKGCFCLPCRGFLPGECWLVASCWRWRQTCCKRVKKEEISEVYLVENDAGYFENIIETKAAMTHGLVANYHDNYSVVTQKKRQNSLIPIS